MKLGIKTSPRTDVYADLEATQPDFNEVWFNVNRADTYRELFSYLKDHHIETGLHFWGALPDKTLSNIAYPEGEISQKSVELVRQTVDIANANGFVYVNIHPGSRALISMDFATQSISLLSLPADPKKSYENFASNAADLTAYALRQDVILTIETVPARIAVDYNSGPESRLKYINAYELPLSVLEKTSDGLEINLANDFGHTAACDISIPVDTIWQNLFRFTQKHAAQTRLIHTGFVIPPYNGTDFHDSLSNPKLSSSTAVPNLQQLQQLLEIFQDRQDVWVLSEPRTDHVGDYFTLKKLVSDLK